MTAKIDGASVRRPASDVLTMIGAGGDERLARDPASGRNPYGLGRLPSAREAYFSSSTASCLSLRGLGAASRAWRAMNARGGAGRLPEVFGDIRRRIAAYCGRPSVDCILAASGTETELLALALAGAALARPLSNIVLAPGETGRGVLAAAGGVHFLSSAPFAPFVRQGARLAGWERADIETTGVEIRRDDGAARPGAEVDEEVWRLACGALARGRGVLVHLLDVSKTGRSGLGVAMAERIVALAPDRVIVLADCCQLRSSPARLAGLVDRGFLLAVTGSKFAGGPPFCGALLIPERLAGRIDPRALAPGLAAYSSVFDWPERLAPAAAAAEPNLGLGLRWAAALGEMERFARVPAALALAVQARFVAEVARGAARLSGLDVLERGADVAAEFAPSIVALALPAPARANAAALQRALRTPAGERGAERGFHLGQPVAFGPEVALRVCLGAPMINDVADRVEGGEALEAAFAPVARDLEDLFAKWAALGAPFA